MTTLKAFWRQFLYVFTLACISTAAGCGGCGGNGGPGPVNFSGDVYFEGEPIPNGLLLVNPIYFDGPAEEVKIVDGNFKANLTPGKKVLDIWAYRPAPPVPGPDGKPVEQKGPNGESVLEKYVPPYYVVRGTLVFDVQEGIDNYLEFDLIKESPEADFLDRNPTFFDDIIEKNRLDRENRRQP